jgi:hypothetical protein
LVKKYSDLCELCASAVYFFFFAPFAVKTSFALEHGELTPAKAQSTPSSEGRDELSWRIFHCYFPTFAAFASLREIFRISVAAQPR